MVYNEKLNNLGNKSLTFHAIICIKLYKNIRKFLKLRKSNIVDIQFFFIYEFIN